MLSKLAKGPLAAVAIQKMCVASWCGLIELVSGKILKVKLEIIERCKIKWLAANAGPVPKAESKEYEMQSGFFVIPNPKHRVVMYAICNQNLQHEGSMRKAFHRTQEIALSFLPCA